MPYPQIQNWPGLINCFVICSCGGHMTNVPHFHSRPTNIHIVFVLVPKQNLKQRLKKGKKHYKQTNSICNQSNGDVHHNKIWLFGISDGISGRSIRGISFHPYIRPNNNIYVYLNKKTIWVFINKINVETIFRSFFEWLSLSDFFVSYVVSDGHFSRCVYFCWSKIWTTIILYPSSIFDTRKPFDMHRLLRLIRLRSNSSTVQ